MKVLNEEHVRAMTVAINRGPYFKLLSMTLGALEPGHCTVEVDLDTKHLNPFGGVHGGVYASIIDASTYMAVYCDLPESAGLVTIDLQVNNLSAVKAGKLVAEAKCIKMGRSLCLSEATVTDADGKIVAHGTSKLMVTHGMQSINQALTAMGNAPLPPKFLG